jgi:hypothetical protein
MGGLRKLRRRSADRYEVEPLRGDLEASYWEPEDWKLSTRIMEIAKPLTDNAADNDEFETIVRMAALCWNVALFPAGRQEQELRSLIATMAKDQPEGFADEVKAWARVLMERKRKLFGSDRRTVVDYTIERAGNTLRFHVVGGLTPR